MTNVNPNLQDASDNFGIQPIKSYFFQIHIITTNKQVQTKDKLGDGNEILVHMVEGHG